MVLEICHFCDADHLYYKAIMFVPQSGGGLKPSKRADYSFSEQKGRQKKQSILVIKALMVFVTTNC